MGRYLGTRDVYLRDRPDLLMRISNKIHNIICNIEEPLTGCPVDSGCILDIKELSDKLVEAYEGAHSYYSKLVRRVRKVGPIGNGVSRKPSEHTLRQRSRKEIMISQAIWDLRRTINRYDAKIDEFIRCTELSEERMATYESKALSTARLSPKEINDGLTELCYKGDIPHSLRWNPTSGGYLRILSKHISLPDHDGNMVDLGAFDVSIQMRGLRQFSESLSIANNREGLAWAGTNSSPAIPIVFTPTEPNTSHDGYDHPHVNNEGEMCFGSESHSIRMMIGRGWISDVLSISLSALESYVPEDSYVRLDNWNEGERCYSCDDLYDRDNSGSHCNQCENQLCDDCSRWCESCDEHIYCPAHYRRCESCRLYIGECCLVACPQCDRLSFCATCEYKQQEGDLDIDCSYCGAANPFKTLQNKEEVTNDSGTVS